MKEALIRIVMWDHARDEMSEMVGKAQDKARAMKARITEGSVAGGH